MTPLEYYQEQCDKGFVVPDDEQRRALVQLDRLQSELLQEHKKRQGMLGKLRKPHTLQGIYLWGSVGIGKTFMMDCFYHCIPFKEKERLHFHQFMQWLHQELQKHQGQKDPLTVIAKKLAKKTMLLCFDELVVTDITDAMLLARLFHALFSHGVCLVATSNTMPDELYKNGLQRKLFLPAIALIKKHTLVIHVTTQIDYRLRHLTFAGVFFTPNDDIAQENMEKCFTVLAMGHTPQYEPIDIHGRKIIIEKKVDDIVWFDFDVICNVPRSQHDYLEISKQFRTVFISNIPVIPGNAKDRISLFIRLIDVFYDARIRLIISASVPIEEIYIDGYLSQDFKRTQSRLLEMQSEAYFSQGLDL